MDATSCDHNLRPYSVSPACFEGIGTRALFACLKAYCSRVALVIECISSNENHCIFSLAVFTVFLRWLFFAFLSAGAESVFLPNIVFLSFSSIARLHPISSLETLQDDEFFFDFFVMIITSQNLFPRIKRSIGCRRSRLKLTTCETSLALQDRVE